MKSICRAQSSASSSNILKLLLSENINRNSDTGDSPQPSMEETDSQSAEEECPEQIEIEDDVEEEEGEKNGLHTRFSQLKKSTSQPSTGAISIPKAWLAKPTTESCESTADHSKEPDLPGRVSFSSNVFEIDFSDLSDDSRFDAPERSQNTKKFVHFEEQQLVQAVPDNTKSIVMDHAQKSDSSSRIIDDYKKEIESLNRRHEEEMTKLNTEQRDVLFFNNSNLVLPVVDIVDSAKSSVVDNYLETIKETDSLEVFEQLESEILSNEERPDVATTPRGMHLQRTLTSTWDNSQRSDERVCSPSSDEKSGDRDEAEKEETLKSVELQKDEDKPRISFNVKKITSQRHLQCNPKNPLRKPKNPQNTRFIPVKPQHVPDPKMRKAKSVSNLKEENHLRDFQMDKVDSWMSINKEQEVDSMRTLMLMKRPQSSHVQQYNKEWRDTPSSKTDDEGNFSLEEANDCFSNESTTYDELVSIIKEIEADKKKADERKNLQADVEFKLKTETSEADMRDALTSDPVK